ncbi:MAG: hypothetical protein AAGA31_20440, partial [Bacteroidota bacterium]
LYLCLLLLLCSFGSTSCVKVSTLVEKGNFERAYALALRHCTRSTNSVTTRGRALKGSDRIVPKKRMKTEQLADFLLAYESIQARDYRRSKVLRNQLSGEKWAELYELYGILYQRSIHLAHLFPREVGFTGNRELLPANLEALRQGARKEAGAFALAQAIPLLRAARSGYKPAARTAYYHYETALSYLPERAESLRLTKDSLEDIGTLRIALYATPEGVYADRVESVLVTKRPFSRNWTRILTNSTKDRIDLEAEVTYFEYDTNGPNETSSSRTYSKRVLDYIEKKEVAEKINDTLTIKKIVEVKHYKHVFATVTTVEQDFTVRARGQVTVYPHDSDSLLWQQQLTGSNGWSNEYELCFGDERALPPCTCSSLDNRKSPPSAGNLLGGAINSMTSRAQQVLINKYAPKTLRRGRRGERTKR